MFILHAGLGVRVKCITIRSTFRRKVGDNATEWVRISRGRCITVGFPFHFHLPLRDEVQRARKVKNLVRVTSIPANSNIPVGQEIHILNMLRWSLDPLDSFAFIREVGEREELISARHDELVVDYANGIDDTTGTKVYVGVEGVLRCEILEKANITLTAHDSKIC